MYARHTPGNLLQEVYCVRFRQQYLPDRGLLSCAEDPSTVYCSPATDATIRLSLANIGAILVGMSS
jgi:hypothetical protein